MAVNPPNDEEFTMETRNISPAHFLIKIESFSSLLECGFRDIQSKEFDAGEHKWKLLIYPNGHDTENDADHVSAFLAICETDSLPLDWEVHAEFKILLYNQTLDNYLCFRGKVRRFSAIKSVWGFSKMISKKSLTDPSIGYVVNDTCVLGAEVFVIKCQRNYDSFKVAKGDASAIKRVWKILKFSKLEGLCSSEEFTAGDCKWKVNLYPRGNKTARGKSVSIYLYCVDLSPHNEVKADFSLSIKDQLNGRDVTKHFSHWFKPSENNWGLTSFVPIVDMRNSSKGLVVDDCCIVEIHVSIQATT